jgi:hypothetical protein
VKGTHDHRLSSLGQDFRGDEYQLELVVADTVLGESVTDKIKVKLATAGPSPTAEDQTVTVTRSQAVVREAPSWSGKRRQ